MALSYWYHMEVFISLYKCIISRLALIINAGLEVILLPLTGFLLDIGDIYLSASSFQSIQVFFCIYTGLLTKNRFFFFTRNRGFSQSLHMCYTSVPNENLSLLTQNARPSLALLALCCR